MDKAENQIVVYQPGEIRRIKKEAFTP